MIFNTIINANDFDVIGVLLRKNCYIYELTRQIKWLLYIINFPSIHKCAKI